MNAQEMHKLIEVFEPRLRQGVTTAMVAAQPLDAAEAMLGVRLPPLYREFVSTYGGTYFGRRAYFDIQDGGDVGSVWPLCSVMGLGLGSSTHILPGAIDYVPDGLMQIGDCDVGFVCIGLREPWFDSVYGCSMALWDGVSEWSGARLAAKSFADFVSGLRLMR